MTYKTVFAGPVFSPSVDGKVPSEALMRYAIGFAAAQGAHLSIGLGCLRLAAPAAVIVREARSLIARANDERKAQAQVYGEDVVRRAAGAGVSASLDLAQEDYQRLSTRLAEFARLADVAVMEADAGAVSLHEGLLEEVLFGSGRPVIIVPPDWAGATTVHKAVVSWDGSAKAARALGDAMPILWQAKEVEIVSVSGDPDASKRIDAAEIAPHVSRHCKNVSVTSLPAQRGDIAATLSAHVKMTHADMLVMGAFARTKLRQLVLGGVTSSMISNPPCPVLMSY